MKKKTVMLVAAIAMILCLAVGGTLAYFTDTDTKTNTFTLGNVAIDLVEENWEKPETVEPGIAYAKDPMVKNTGANDAYIRLDVTVSDYEAFVKACAKHEITELESIFGGYDNHWERYAKNNGTYSYLWSDEEGKPLAVTKDEHTGYIFKTVTIPACFDNDDLKSLGKDFTITVKAFAIQANADDQADVIAELKAMTAEE